MFEYSLYFWHIQEFSLTEIHFQKFISHSWVEKNQNFKRHAKLQGWCAIQLELIFQSLQKHFFKTYKM